MLRPGATFERELRAGKPAHSFEFGLLFVVAYAPAVIAIIWSRAWFAMAALTLVTALLVLGSWLVLGAVVHGAAMRFGGSGSFRDSLLVATFGLTLSFLLASAGDLSISLWTWAQQRGEVGRLAAQQLGGESSSGPVSAMMGVLYALGLAWMLVLVAEGSRTAHGLSRAQSLVVAGLSLLALVSFVLLTLAAASS